MSKSQQNSIVSLINIILGLASLFLWYSMNLSLYSLLGGLLLSIIISQTIGRFLPEKQNKKVKSSSIKKNPSTSKKTSTITNKSNTIRSEDKLLTLPLEELNWREFERLCFLYYKGKGYKVEETSEGADGGVDLIVYNRHHKQNVAIQIKHRSKPIGVEPLRALNGAKRNYGCVLADFISSSGYTKNALIEADNLKIKCHTADKILSWREQEVKKRKLA